MLNYDIVGGPKAPGLLNRALMNSTKSCLEELKAVIRRSDALLPDVHGPLLRLLGVSLDYVQYRLRSRALGQVLLLVSCQHLHPSIEHSLLQAVALRHQSQVRVLLSKAQWLERCVIPLVQCDLLSIETESQGNLGEGLQLLMADAVEGGVVAQLLESVTASGHLQSLHDLLQNLGGDELGLPATLVVELESVHIVALEHLIESAS